MAYTQADLDSIREAIASGELEVQHSDGRIKYRSIKELLAAEQAIISGLKEVDGSQYAKVGNRSFIVCSDSGL